MYDNDDNLDMCHKARTLALDMFAKNSGVELSNFYFPEQKLFDALNKLLKREAKFAVGKSYSSGSIEAAFHMLGEEGAKRLMSGVIRLMFMEPGNRTTQSEFSSLHAEIAIQVAATSLCVHYIVQKNDRGLNTKEELPIRRVDWSYLAEKASAFSYDEGRDHQFALLESAPIVWIDGINKSEKIRNVSIGGSKTSSSHTTASSLLQGIILRRMHSQLPTILTTYESIDELLTMPWLVGDRLPTRLKDAESNNPDSEHVIFSHMLRLRFQDPKKVGN